MVAGYGLRYLENIRSNDNLAEQANRERARKE
jgi:hypothetical protein